MPDFCLSLLVPPGLETTPVPLNLLGSSGLIRHALRALRQHRALCQYFHIFRHTTPAPALMPVPGWV